MQTWTWVGEALLVVAFGYSGVCKASQPVGKLAAMGQSGVEGLPTPLVRFIGTSELLGVLGLLLPPTLAPARVLGPAAAFGLAAIMLPAALIHTRRNEPRNVAINLVLFAIAIGVGIARLR